MKWIERRMPTYRKADAVFGPAVLAVTFLTLAYSAPAYPAAEPTEKPNIIFFLADDMGWGDLRAYNPNSKIDMPNLERLAEQGMRFTDVHTSAAKCAPTRYSVLTGNYQWRGFREWGYWQFRGGSQILSGQRTIADVLQDSGYDTAMFGKLHLGGDFYRKGTDEFITVDDPEDQINFSRQFLNGPLDCGFNDSFLVLRGIQASPYAYFENDLLVGDPNNLVQWLEGVYGNSEIVADGIGLPDWDSSQVGPTLAQKAIDFIDHHHQKNLDEGTDIPFFVYYASQAPHGPHTPPELFLGEPVKGVTRMNEHTDMIYENDVALGKLIEAIEERGLADNTLIIFTSDNGGLPGGETQFGHDTVGGLRGRKGEIWEGGHRVPFVAKWGDGSAEGSVIPPGTTSDQLIGVHDSMATLAALVNKGLPAEQARDSFNFLPVLLGERGDDDEPIRDHTIMEADARDQELVPRHFAIREGQWKLIFDENQDVSSLYNLADDLAETTNLLDDPDQVERIERMRNTFLQLHGSTRTAPMLVLPEPSSLPILGKPAYQPGQGAGIFIWKDRFDGPYQLRVSGEGPNSIFELNVISERPFDSVEPQLLETNDSLTTTDNRLAFTSQVTTWEDGVDFVLPPGTRALFTVDRDADPNRQVYVGASGQQLVPTSWIADVEELPSSPPFTAGESLGLFLGRDQNGTIAARWNGDGLSHQTDLLFIFSSPISNATQLSIEPCCDFLTVTEFTVETDSTVSTWWDGIDVSVQTGTQMGFAYRQDGLIQPHLVNPQTGDIDLPNAFELPIADLMGEPDYNPSENQGLYIWQDETGIWHLRVTAGGSFGHYAGIIAASAASTNVTAVALEDHDLLDLSDPDQIEFDFSVWDQAMDGLDFEFPIGTALSLSLNGNTSEAAQLVKIGRETWPVSHLPVDLVR